MTRFRLGGIRHKLQRGPQPVGLLGPRQLPAGVLDCRIAANEHGAYAVPRSSEHRPAARAILSGDVWERETVDLLRGCDPQRDIVHAGTFFGDFLPALARSRSDGARVYAFEPSSENYRCAQITVLLNGLSNVDLRHAALGSEAGVGTLATSSADGLALGGGSHLVDDSEPVKGELVQLTSVDAVVPTDRQVAVVHLDVEGYERAALTGALQTIRRCRPLLVLETVPPADWLDAHLGNIGYAVVQNLCGNSVLTPRPA